MTGVTSRAENVEQPLMRVQVDTDPDLSVAIGNQTARLSPGEAFRLAERLIRSATARMICEEADRAQAESARGRH